MEKRSFLIRELGRRPPSPDFSQTLLVLAPHRHKLRRRQGSFWIRLELVVLLTESFLVIDEIWRCHAPAVIVRPFNWCPAHGRPSHFDRHHHHSFRRPWKMTQVPRRTKEQ